MSTNNRVAQSLSQGDIKLEVDESIKPTHNENGQKLIYCSDGVITEDEIMAEESHIDEFEWLDVMTLQGKPEEMSWAKWIMYKTGRGVGHTLAYLESWGEAIAKEFGITEPIHQDILDLRDQIMEDAGEPITGFPEPRSEPVQFEPPRFETIFEADDAKK